MPNSHTLCLSEHGGGECCFVGVGQGDFVYGSVSGLIFHPRVARLFKKRNSITITSSFALCLTFTASHLLSSLCSLLRLLGGRSRAV